MPEDAEVSLVGCFAESQLGKTELKYYAESNAASFNAMYWHAHNDHVPYFAMSRHREALGHAFTAHYFAHEGEKPKWGVYDGCGSRCEDDDSRWCGCSNEAERGFPNHDCEEGTGEKRFAVYKIVEHTTSPPEKLEPAAANATASAEGGTSAAESDSSSGPVAAAPAQPRPYWQLTKDGGDPAIEIVVPKGQTAKAHGRQVVLYNATSDAPEGEIAVGKMKLPADVDPTSCVMEAGKAADGGQVMKCNLQAGTVRQIPIKVMDEL